MGNRCLPSAPVGEIWRATLETYEQSPLDEALREEFVVRRRAELGD